LSEASDRRALKKLQVEHPSLFHPKEGFFQQPESTDRLADLRRLLESEPPQHFHQAEKAEAWSALISSWIKAKEPDFQASWHQLRDIARDPKARPGFRRTALEQLEDDYKEFPKYLNTLRKCTHRSLLVRFTDTVTAVANPPEGGKPLQGMTLAREMTAAVEELQVAVEGFSTVFRAIYEAAPEPPPGKGESNASWIRGGTDEFLEAVGKESVGVAENVVVLQGLKAKNFLAGRVEGSSGEAALREAIAACKRMVAVVRKSCLGTTPGLRIEAYCEERRAHEGWSQKAESVFVAQTPALQMFLEQLKHVYVSLDGVSDAFAEIDGVRRRGSLGGKPLPLLDSHKAAGEAVERALSALQDEMARSAGRQQVRGDRQRQGAAAASQAAPQGDPRARAQRPQRRTAAKANPVKPSTAVSHAAGGAQASPVRRRESTSPTSSRSAVSSAVRKRNLSEITVTDVVAIPISRTAEEMEWVGWVMGWLGGAAERADGIVRFLDSAGEQLKQVRMSDADTGSETPLFPELDSCLPQFRDKVDRCSADLKRALDSVAGTNFTDSQVAAACSAAASLGTVINAGLGGEASPGQPPEFHSIVDEKLRNGLTKSAFTGGDLVTGMNSMQEVYSWGVDAIAGVLSVRDGLGLSSPWCAGVEWPERDRIDENVNLNGKVIGQLEKS
jgi:hypothetical protein